MKDRVLTGKKRITGFVERSWKTVRRWIEEEEFPAKKMDGVWESDADLITEWRVKQIKEGKTGQEEKNDAE